MLGLQPRAAAAARASDVGENAAASQQRLRQRALKFIARSAVRAVSEKSAQRATLKRPECQAIRGTTRFVCKVKIRSVYMFSATLPRLEDSQRIAEEGRRRLLAGDHLHSVKMWASSEKRAAWSAAAGRALPLAAARAARAAAARAAAETAAPAAVDISEDAPRQRQRPLTIRLTLKFRRGSARLQCAAGAEHMFSVELVDVKRAVTIAEEGRRRLLAGDSFYLVTNWVKSQTLAARSAWRALSVADAAVAGAAEACAAAETVAAAAVDQPADQHPSGTGSDRAEPIERLIARLVSEKAAAYSRRFRIW